MKNGRRLRMPRGPVRMALRSRNFFVYFVAVVYLVDAIHGSIFSSSPTGSVILARRHRRSYDQRRRGGGKDAGGVATGGKGAATPGADKPGPFATENGTVVVAQAGGTTTMPCVVRKSNSATVSWLRQRDHHLLTVGPTTYDTGDRFMVEHARHLQNWDLFIKQVVPSDAGLYKCQVATHPPTSILVELRVTKAVAEIQGAPDLYLRAGSALRLVCTLRGSTEPPAFVFWYREGRMINYDPGVAVRAVPDSSVLRVRDADRSHEGNYTCSPANAAPASVYVHVLNATAEEKPAAMQHANSSHTVGSSNLVTSGVLVVVTTFLLATST